MDKNVRDSKKKNFVYEGKLSNFNALGFFKDFTRPWNTDHGARVKTNTVFNPDDY
jgi:hypothetical protein